MLTRMTMIAALAISLIVAAAPAFAADSGYREAADAVNKFAFDIYRKCAPEGESSCISPYSIASAFSMLYAGAAGETAAELERVLGWSPSIHESMSVLRREMTDIPDEAAQLFVANSIWPALRFRMREEYTSLLERGYAAEVRPQDYAADPDASRRAIDEWVEEHTMGKIKDIMPEGSVNALTSLVLVNALYFRSAWINEFPKGATSSELFRAPSGYKKVDMMKKKGDSTPYAQLDGLSAVKKLYRFGVWSMTIILPDEGRDIADLEASLDVEMLREIDGAMGVRDVDLWLPRFKIESTFDLVDPMKDLGVASVFSPLSADLSGIDGERDLSVSSAIHKAIIEVDEAGTEAAAATALGLRTTSFMEPEPPVIFHADRPFIYMIRSETTGAVLFIGRVLEP